MKNKTKTTIGIGIIISLMLFVGVIYPLYLSIGTFNHNEYWANRFNDKVCQKVCNQSGFGYGGENPSTCFCRDYNIMTTYKDINGKGLDIQMPKQVEIDRPHSFRDNIQIIYETFGGK